MKPMLIQWREETSYYLPSRELVMYNKSIKGLEVSYESNASRLLEGSLAPRPAIFLFSDLHRD